MSSSLRNFKKEDNLNIFNQNINYNEVPNGYEPNYQQSSNLNNNNNYPLINNQNKNQLLLPIINNNQNFTSNRNFSNNNLPNTFNLNNQSGSYSSFNQKDQSIKNNQGKINQNNNIQEFEENPNEGNNKTNSRALSRQGNRSENTLNNQNKSNNYNQANTNGNNNYFDYNLILQEITNFKKIIKNVLENQNDFQNRMIDNTRLLSEQENIMRLNNIKLNEHDSKLTEILVTFNNFMNFNEKTNKIIKELTAKYDDSAKKSEFSDLKMNLYNLNKNNEIKIQESNGKVEDINLKYEELKKEQDIFQKYTLEKLKNYQNENMENRIQQQQHLIKLEESRENKFLQQIEQIKILIKNLEQNFNTENTYRKSAMDNNKTEGIQLIKQTEEKMTLLEKSSLEMEKKILNFSKDYITTFHELIAQNNQNFDIEIKSLKNIFTNNLIKYDKKSEENLGNLSNQMKTLSEINEYNKACIDNVELTIKDKISSYDKNLKFLNTHLEEINNKQHNFKQDFENSNTELNKNLNNRINLLNENIQEKLKSFNSEIYEKYNLEKLLNENLISDNKENLEMFKNQFNNLISEINLKIERKIKQIDLEEINFDSKLNEKFSNYKEDNDEYRKKLILLINNNIQELKNNMSKDSKDMVDNISNKLDLKINYLKENLEKQFKNDGLVNEGNMHKCIYQVEEKLFKIIESKINPLQNQVDDLIEKNSIK